MKKLLTLLLAFLSFSIAQGANMLTSAEVNVTRLSTTRPVTISLSTAARKSLATLSSSGATVKMQWYSQNGESGTPTAMTGQTSYQLSVTPSNSSVFSKRFFVRVSITSGGTTKSENSELARLVSNTSITQQPTNQEYINGTNKPVVFTASASTCVGRTRRWYKNGVEIADDAAGFSGQSTDSLVIDVTTSGVKDGDRFSMRANSPYGKTAYAESDKAYLSISNDYSLGFYVCGTDVMASMADDIRPQDNSLKSGKIYFANNTLYLDNIFVDTNEDFLYLEEGNDVGDIKVLGTDSIRCEKLIVYDHDMVGASTLGGPGKLSVVAYDYLIDGRSGATHVFEDANLSISCYSFVNRCNLIINHSNISAHSAYFAQDSKEDTSLKLQKCAITTPGVTFSSSTLAFMNGSEETGDFEIEATYGVSVAGNVVTDKNKDDVLGDGTIRYDDVTNTLILTNANIQATGGDDCILVSDNNVTIQLIGINNITSDNHAGIKFEHCTGGKIVGPGCATIKAATIGLYAYDSDITIKECALFVSATNYGMCGYDAKSSENVTIDNAFVSLTGTDFFSCGDLNSLTLNNAKFTVSGIAFYPSLHGVSTDGGSSVTKNTVNIAPSAGGYPITVKGFVLYNFNAADPLGDGTVSYDSATNTLTLNNANISYEYDAIAVYDDIRIEVIGKNNISSDNYNAINVDDVYDTYIVGDENAVLNLNADRGDGFYGGELHISGGCTVNAVGEMYGLALTGEDLYIDNSSLTATSNSMDANEHAISGMKSEPILSNVYLATEGIHYDATKKAYVDADGKYAKTVSFKSIEDYKIEVADIEVTNLNANDVLGDGKVTYDSATRTLTLNNASISEGSISYGIHIQTDNITIKLIGNNIIGNQTASEGLYIVGSKGTKIVGPGKATFEGYSLGIYIQNSDLTISDCEIIAKALQYGIAGDYNDGETLTISNAKVTAELTGTESDKIGTIMDLKDFVLNGVSILSPTGATYNATTGDIEVEGAVTKETVVIGKETPVYTLTISAGENGSVNTAVNGTYEEGTSVELIATANSGYKFEKWSDGNTENPRTLVMDKDYTLTASFVEESVIIVKYTINADANDAAMGSVSGAGEYVENSDVTLVATANTSYEFVNWTKGGTEVSTSATYTFKATDDMTLVANFKAEVYYTIAASTNNATMGSVSGAGNYKENSDVTLTATAKTGYVFVNWTKGGAEVSTSSTYTFKATENVTLVANFKAADPNKYTVVLTINNPIMGTATGAGEYEKNASVTLKAIANTGYEFVNWTKDGSEVSTDAEYTFTITANITLQANFKALTDPVTLTVYSIGEGTVNGKAIFTKTVEKGTTITLTATPNTGSELLHWNTKDYGDTETTIDVDMDGDITIAAIFGSDADSYKLTARADDDEEEYGKVSIQLCVDEMNDTYIKAISGMYPKDTRFKIQAIAEGGYEFVCWNKDDEEPNTNAIRNIVLSKKTSLYAHFKKATDLDEVMNAEGDNTMYDILGRRVDANYRGIVIINGKKTLMR